MEKYDVIIVGGGPAGLGCALTLASAKGHFDWGENRKYLVIDNNSSDLLKAKLNNVPGVKPGSLGKDVINQLKEHVKMYENVEIIDGKVVKVEGEYKNFKVITENGKEFYSDFVVFATGFHEFNIECEDMEVIENKKSPRPGKVQLKVDQDYKIKEGVYAAGLIAGVSTMFATAAGSGVQVACNIQAIMAGKNVVVHDVPDSK